MQTAGSIGLMDGKMIWKQLFAALIVLCFLQRLNAVSKTFNIDWMKFPIL